MESNKTQQDIDFWNTEESITRYFNMDVSLWDSESSLLFSAVQKLNKKVSDIKVLDLGCGGGRTTVPLHNMGFDVTGLDIAKNLIDLMHEKYPDVKAVVGDACKLDFADHSFDIVIFSHNSIDCLYPYEKRVDALKEISRVLKPKGFYIFSSHVFNVIPFNFTVLKNVARNIADYVDNPDHGYYKEQMDNGDVVDLFYASKEFIEKELSDVDLKMIADTRIVDQYRNLFETFIRSALNWERYYLAQKVDSNQESYKDLFEGRFTRTFDRKMSSLEKLYFDISPSTHNEKTIFKMLDKYAGTNNKILDVGCGGGFAGLNKYGDVYGIDVSEGSIENAKKIYHEAKVVDASKGIPYPDNFFDVVYCSEVFGHIYKEDKNKLLKELRRVLKQNGQLFFSIETDGENILTKHLKKNNLYQKYWIDYHGHIGLETPSNTVDRLSEFFEVEHCESTSSHILPIDGYLTFIEPYPWISILKNTLLRRILNILILPIFYTTLVLSPFNTSNDIVCHMKNVKRKT